VIDGGPLAEGKELASTLVIPSAIAAGVTLVKMARFGWTGWRHFVSSFSMSLFCGISAYWGLDYFQFGPTVDAAITSMAAYAGDKIIDAIVYRARHEILEKELSHFKKD